MRTLALYLGLAVFLLLAACGGSSDICYGTSPVLQAANGQTGQPVPGPAQTPGGASIGQTVTVQGACP